MQIPWGCIQGPSTVGSPIVTPEDLRGRKLRMGSGSEFYAPAIRDKGGIPVSLTGAELYMGLQRGTIDSIMMCASSHLLDRKLYEVQDSWTPIPPVTSVNSIIFMNKKFFDGLPVDLQQVVLKANAEAYQEVKEVGSFQHLLQREKLEEENLINIHEITQEEGKVWLEWINPYVMEVMRTKSLEGREIFKMIQKLKEDMGDEPMPRLE
jgi:C4-dicarboxylate-binding protein DctP